MPIAYTSRIGYRAIQEDLRGLQREVWEAIRTWPHPHIGPSIEDLARKLGRKESSICGRIAELRAAGTIEDAPLKMGGCGVEVKTYRAIVWQEPCNRVAQLTLL
jgi:hypothetical protein